MFFELRDNVGDQSYQHHDPFDFKINFIFPGFPETKTGITSFFLPSVLSLERIQVLPLQENDTSIL